jgi:hypothetical protein
LHVLDRCAFEVRAKSSQGIDKSSDLLGKSSFRRAPNCLPPSLLKDAEVSRVRAFYRDFFRDREAPPQDFAERGRAAGHSVPEPKVVNGR